MTVRPLVHEIRIQNQVIFLDPPIEHARASWLHQLHEWLGACSVNQIESPAHTSSGVVCRLRRIQSSRYEIGLQMQGGTLAESTYTSLVRFFAPPLHCV